MARLFFYNTTDEFKSAFNIALNTRVFCAIARKDIDDDRRKLRNDLKNLEALKVQAEEQNSPVDEFDKSIQSTLDRIEVLTADRRAFSNYENNMLFGEKALYTKIFGNLKDLTKSFESFATTNQFKKWDNTMTSIIEGWGIDCDTKNKDLVKRFCHAAARSVSLDNASDKDVAMRKFKKDSVATKRLVSSIANGVFENIKDIDGLEKFDRKANKVTYTMDYDYDDNGCLVATLTSYQVVDR